MIHLRRSCFRATTAVAQADRDSQRQQLGREKERPAGGTRSAPPELDRPDAFQTRSTSLSTASHRTRLHLPQEIREPPTRSKRETASFHMLSAVTRHQHRALRTRNSSHLQHGVLRPQLRQNLRRTVIRRGPNRGFIAAARDGVFRVFARSGGSRLHRAGRLRHRGVGQLPPRHGRAGRLIAHGTTEVPPFIVIFRRRRALGGAGGTCRRRPSGPRPPVTAPRLRMFIFLLMHPLRSRS